MNRLYFCFVSDGRLHQGNWISWTSSDFENPMKTSTSTLIRGIFNYAFSKQDIRVKPAVYPAAANYCPVFDVIRLLRRGVALHLEQE